MSRVLVAFATKHGSTREVAEAIAVTLRAHGHTAQVSPARSSHAPADDWDLVILGGPLHSGRWHRDARRFLRRHHRELVRVPVAIYALGPPTRDSVAWQRARAQLDRTLTPNIWFHPVAVTVFGGVDPKARRGRPRRDLRDWNVIRRWAQLVVTRAATPAEIVTEITETPVPRAKSTVPQRRRPRLWPLMLPS